MGDDESDEMALSGGDSWGEIGEFMNAIGAISLAMGAHGTERTLGLFGSANQSAKFHEGLIKMRTSARFRVLSRGFKLRAARYCPGPRAVPARSRGITQGANECQGTFCPSWLLRAGTARGPGTPLLSVKLRPFQVAGGGDELLGDLPELLVGGLLLGIFGDGKQAGEQPDDIAIEDWLGFVKSDARDGTGGVATNAGQFEDGLITPGKLALVVGDNLAGGALQVADAGVIAEAFPEFVDGFGIGVREGLEVGQGAQPAFPVGDDGLDLGLLQHDLRYPHGVGVSGTTPRQIAGVQRKPAEQRRNNCIGSSRGWSWHSVELGR